MVDAPLEVYMVVRLDVHLARCLYAEYGGGLYTVAIPARGLLNREKTAARESLAAPPPPPPPLRCSYGGEINTGHVHQRQKKTDTQKSIS